MSNEAFSKTEIIVAAARTILLGDNAVTGNTVGSIESYAANRIQREDLEVKVEFPKIDLSCEEGSAEISLPSRMYFLTVKPRTHMDGTTPQTTLDRLATRIDFLLNNKPSSLNGASTATGKNLRCRLLIQESALRIPDSVERTYTKVMRYRVICDDENLTIGV